MEGGERGAPVGVQGATDLLSDAGCLAAAAAALETLDSDFAPPEAEGGSDDPWARSGADDTLLHQQPSHEDVEPPQQQPAAPVRLPEHVAPAGTGPRQHSMTSEECAADGKHEARCKRELWKVKVVHHYRDPKTGWINTECIGPVEGKPDKLQHVTVPRIISTDLFWYNNLRTSSLSEGDTVVLQYPYGKVKPPTVDQTNAMLMFVTNDTDPAMAAPPSNPLPFDTSCEISYLGVLLERVTLPSNLRLRTRQNVMVPCVNRSGSPGAAKEIPAAVPLFSQQILRRATEGEKESGCPTQLSKNRQRKKKKRQGEGDDGEDGYAETLPPDLCDDYDELQEADHLDSDAKPDSPKAGRSKGSSSLRASLLKDIANLQQAIATEQARKAEAVPIEDFKTALAANEAIAEHETAIASRRKMLQTLPDKEATGAPARKPAAAAAAAAAAPAAAATSAAKPAQAQQGPGEGIPEIKLPKKERRRIREREYQQKRLEETRRREAAAVAAQQQAALVQAAHRQHQMQLAAQQQLILQNLSQHMDMGGLNAAAAGLSPLAINMLDPTNLQAALAATSALNQAAQFGDPLAFTELASVSSAASQARPRGMPPRAATYHPTADRLLGIDVEDVMAARQLSFPGFFPSGGSDAGDFDSV